MIIAVFYNNLMQYMTARLSHASHKIFMELPNSHIILSTSLYFQCTILRFMVFFFFIYKYMFKKFGGSRTKKTKIKEATDSSTNAVHHQNLGSNVRFRL